MVTKIENAVIRAIKDCILNLTKKNDKDTSINVMINTILNNFIVRLVVLFKVLC